MNYANMPLSFALVVVAAIVACGGGPTKATPTPMPVTTATSEPAVVGPILVYTKETPLDARIGHVETFVSAYDIAAGHEIRRNTIEQAVIPKLNQASGEVFYLGQFKDGQEIHAMKVVTGVDRLIYRPNRPIEPLFAISPDGALMVVSELESEEDRTSHTYVVVVDLADGSARTIATFGSQFLDEFRGRPAPMVWRDDGQGVVVAGDTSSGAPGTWATVMLDGSVRRHLTEPAFPSPSGRFLDVDGSGENCLLPGTQELRLIDLDTNAEVARVEDPGRGIGTREWSPEGDALLYDQFDPEPGTENDPCRSAYDASSRRSFLLRTSGGSPEPVADVGALLARWHPEARIELTCVYAATNVFDTCPGPDQRRLSVNGASVDTGENIRIVGFLHNPN